jgi:signal transduction histidine kinase
MIASGTCDFATPAKLTTGLTPIYLDTARGKVVPDRDLAARRLLAVTEEELHRVVLDIHDGPVQNLFAAVGQLSLVRARLASQPDTRESVKGIAIAMQLLETSLDEIRAVITMVQAPAFAERTLPEIVEELVVQHETLAGSAVTLEYGASLPVVTPLIKIALYRIVQEALSNIRRHAGVTTATVRLWEDDGMVRLEVEDAGRGFRPPPLTGPNATEEERHIGLRGMRERAAMVCGALSVDSQPGAGTRVVVHVPLHG